MNIFPYSNFHELNLDWIIDELKKTNENLNDFIKLNTIKYADPLQWDITDSYEANTVVIDEKTGYAYLSSQPVPPGVDIERAEYWIPIFNVYTIYEQIKDGVAFNNRSVDTSLFDIPVGGLVWVNQVLYKATKNITKGDRFTVSNTVKTTVDNEIRSLLAYATNLEKEIAKTNNEITKTKNDLQAEINTTNGNINTIGGKVDGNTNAIAALNTKVDKKQDVSKYCVNSFGAVGDGVTDCTTAFNNAVKAAKGGTIYLLEGKYKISAPITCDGVSVDLNGCTVLLTTASAAFTFSGCQDSYSIYGGTIDCGSVANNAVVINGNCSGFTVHDVYIKNAAVSSIITSTLATAGHQNINNCRIHNPDTMATCITINSPDVYIRGCELYYSKECVRCNSTALFMVGCHTWSGGAKADSYNNDCGVNMVNGGSIVLDNCYLDSHTYGIISDNILNVTGSVFAWYDSERHFAVSEPCVVMSPIYSKLNLDTVCDGSADVRIHPWFCNNIYKYTVNPANKTSLKMHDTKETKIALTSPYFDTSNGHKALILNREENVVNNTYYLIGYIVPTTDSWVNVTLSNGKGSANISIWVSRDSVGAKTQCSNTMETYTVAIGNPRIIDAEKQQIVACPIYLKRSAVSPYGVVGYSTGGDTWCNLFYATKTTASDIAVEIPSTV